MGNRSGLRQVQVPAKIKASAGPSLNTRWLGGRWVAYFFAVSRPRVEWWCGNCEFLLTIICIIFRVLIIKTNEACRAKCFPFSLPLAFPLPTPPTTAEPPTQPKKFFRNHSTYIPLLMSLSFLKGTSPKTLCNLQGHWSGRLLMILLTESARKGRNMIYRVEWITQQYPNGSSSFSRFIMTL